jgi:hypothetical protein
MRGKSDVGGEGGIYLRALTPGTRDFHEAPYDRSGVFLARLNLCRHLRNVLFASRQASASELRL